MKLYSYFRSSASYRVRIALGLKELPYDYVPVDLLQKEQLSAAYLAENPEGRVPALDTGEGIIVQSMAILEWLEETHPLPPLLPASPMRRAQVRATANLIACDIQPLNNLSVMEYLRGPLAADERQVNAWYSHWVTRAFTPVEQAIAEHGGNFCHGDTPTLADVCLVPQVYNAERFNVPMEAFPGIRRVTDHCNRLPAFAAADPAAQPDA